MSSHEKGATVMSCLQL